ncbi:MAG: PilN domain-containing protein [Candidatus Aminicenantes bacterium]|nr:PilN domain-containing protein [Candidatus Aminicenantes bacterium]
MIRVNLLKTDIKAGDKKTPIGAPVAGPVESKPEKAKKSNVVNLIIFLVIAVLGALAFLQKKSLDSERALLSEAQEQQRVLTPVLQKLELVEQQKIFLESKIGLIEELRGRQAIPLQVLDALSRNLPEWVWLMEATYNAQALEIKGRGLSNIQISEYSKALQKSGLFSDVTISSSNQITVGNNVFQEFILKAQLPAPAATKGPVAK